ncbi:hypothetical protein CAXC1_120011 [Candidatus Xenohaliotis californiensis]|uniref:Uncharacterized protein n=1 Tax=Candidatus Xenohaliotis californiensis TaxID=84677 RepID=A0ABP0ERJ9_9RICK|nr:hypothetical protein CAXC1_120011 [Candidatus Xenohaliotis californiensis]
MLGDAENEFDSNEGVVHLSPAIFYSKDYQIGLLVLKDKEAITNMYMNMVMIPGRSSVQFINGQKSDGKHKGMGAMLGDQLIYWRNGKFYSCFCYAGGERSQQYTDWLRDELVQFNSLAKPSDRKTVSKEVFQSPLFSRKYMSDDIDLTANDQVSKLAEDMLTTSVLQKYKKITKRMLDDYHNSTSARIVDLYCKGVNSRLKKDISDSCFATRCVSDITPLSAELNIDAKKVVVESLNEKSGILHAKTLFAKEAADMLYKERENNSSDFQFLGEEFHIDDQGISFYSDKHKHFIGELFELSGMLPKQMGEAKYSYHSTGAYSLDKAYALYAIARCVGSDAMRNAGGMQCVALHSFDNFKKYESDSDLDLDKVSADVMSEAFKNLRVGYASFNAMGPHISHHVFHFVNTNGSDMKTLQMQLEEMGIKDVKIFNDGNKSHRLHIPIGCSRSHFIGQSDITASDIADAANGLALIRKQVSLTVMDADCPKELMDDKLASDNSDFFKEDVDTDLAGSNDSTNFAPESIVAKRIKIDAIEKEDVGEKSRKVVAGEGVDNMDIEKAVSIFGLKALDEIKHEFTKLQEDGLSSASIANAIDLVVTLSDNMSTLIRKLHNATSEEERSMSIHSIERAVKTEKLAAVLVGMNFISVKDLFSTVKNKDIVKYLLYFAAQILFSLGFKELSRNIIVQLHDDKLGAALEVAVSNKDLARNAPQLFAVLQEFSNTVKDAGNKESTVNIVVTSNNSDPEYYLCYRNHFVRISSDMLTDEQKDKALYWNGKTGDEAVVTVVNTEVASDNKHEHNMPTSSLQQASTIPVIAPQLVEIY